MQSPILSEYDYVLPEGKIAIHPLTERDTAKMLVYTNKGEITHSTFRSLPDFLPADTLLVLNDTRVVHARLLFQRETGAQIEVFCLHPVAPHTEMNLAMQVTRKATWECLAGNQRRWKTGETLTMPLPGNEALQAALIEKKGREVIVEFTWGNIPFAEVLEIAGKMPLPPYIHREAEMQDEEDYQTVFAKENGAVAAPTAGLHITGELLQKIQAKDIDIDYVTLHVGAGTFQPVEHENVLEHPMHREQVMFSKELIQKLADTNRKVIALGTTVMRALESLYWFGNALETKPDTEIFFVEKLQPYTSTENIPLRQAMENIIKWMDARKKETITGETEIFIFPGYGFKICKGLITNFHLPQSTLLMLVAAFIGDDWKDLYDKALASNYRFLSYGDGMLLLPD